MVNKAVVNTYPRCVEEKDALRYKHMSLRASRGEKINKLITFKNIIISSPHN